MTIYTETVIHGEVPYQIAIVDLGDGTRVTGRIEGERVVIDNAVVEIDTVDGVRWFRKQ
jgi:uncharacterized OB-fold protein